MLILALRVVHFSLIERLSTMFRDLQPKEVSIYDPYFWWHERFWKLSWQPLILDGTPFKNLTWRLQGVRIGKRVFDDGCAIVEKTLVSIGDHCTLSVRSIVQAHSQESGAFKSDRIAIGSGCTLGIASLVHYGVDHGRRRGARAGLLPHEGRGSAGARAVGRKPRRERQLSVPSRAPRRGPERHLSGSASL